MTGRYPFRTGVTSAIGGWNNLRRDETTMAQVFAANGYRTAMFGKWHLGDEYPYRPHDGGFHDAVTFGAGAISTVADYWGNDYFDDTYQHNGVPEKYSGYCTDVFFNEGLKFVEANRDRPFFLFLPLNAPHSPYNVDERYSRPYAEMGVAPPIAAFYGMIANIDENIGRLRKRLKELSLDENTILIFLTDNGSALGSKAFNAGMREAKGSPYEGGHRVPCFFHWPAAGIRGGRDVSHLAAHIDILPTLIDLAGLKPPPASNSTALA